MKKYVTYLRTNLENSPSRMFEYDSEAEAKQYCDNMNDKTKHPDVEEAFYQVEN